MSSFGALPDRRVLTVSIDWHATLCSTVHKLLLLGPDGEFVSCSLPIGHSRSAKLRILWDF